MTKKNILFLNGTMHIGGAENVIAILVRNIDKDKFNILICHINQEGDVCGELKAAGFQVISLPKKNNKKANYFSSLELRRVVKKYNIDIIHSHDLASFFDATICRLITPKVRHIHTYHFGNYPYRPKRYLLMEKMLWRIPDRLVAVGNDQRKRIKKTFGIPDNRIMTIWNGIEPVQKKEVGVIRKLVFGNKKVRIGSISTITRQKGIGDLLKIIFEISKKRNDFELVIVGDGPLKNRLESTAKKLGLEKFITWLGWVPNANESILPELDIFVQSSHWEAMSIVILEAMAAEKAIVATAVGENSEVLEDEISGLIIPSGNIKQFAEKLEQLIDNRKLREDLGKEAGKRFLKYFTARKMVNEYENLYQEVN